MMDVDRLKRKVYDALKGGRFSSPDDLVDLSDGTEGLVHLVVVSRKFDGLRAEEADNLIWAELDRGLSEEEQRRISLVIGVSPEEVKAY